MPYPVRVEGRRRASPKGGNREAALRASAVAMSYGDLNAGGGLGELDGGIERESLGTATCNLAAPR